MTGSGSLSTWPPGEEPTCPECGAPAVDRSNARRTLVAGTRGYDEDGELHVHDPNASITTLTCENDHSWERRSYRECPAAGCDYNKGRGGDDIVDGGDTDIVDTGMKMDGVGIMEAGDSPDLRIPSGTTIVDDGGNQVYPLQSSGGWFDRVLSHRFLPILLLWLPGAIFLASFFGSIIDAIIGSSTFWGLIPNGHILVAVFVMIVFVAVLKFWWEIVDWGVGRVRG